MMIVQPLSPAPGSSPTTRSAVVMRDRLARGRTGPLDAVVLDAPSLPALITLRELGLAGLTVGAVASVPDAPAFASRWCLVSAVVPDFNAHPQGYSEGLLSLLDHHPACVLIPTSAASMAHLHALRPILEPQSALALAGDDAIAAAMDSERIADQARRLGILPSRRARVRAWNDIKSAMRHVGLPAVVRPTHATRAFRAITVRSEDEAWRAAEAVAETGADITLEQWLPGPRESVSVLFAHERIWAHFAQIARRTLPGRDDMPIESESIALPSDTASHTQRLVRSLDLQGFAEAVFQRDAEGQPILIEIVPHLTDTIELAARAGINFPRLAFAWAAGEPLWSVPEYRVGVRQRSLSGDLRALQATFTHPPTPGTDTPIRALSAVLRDTVRPSAYGPLDWRDPAPTLIAATHLAKRTLLRAARVSTAAARSTPVAEPAASPDDTVHGRVMPAGSRAS